MKKNMLAAAAFAFVAGVCLAAGETGPAPWSHRNFQDDPGDFRFAIVPDRGGGDYRGAFTNALRCADLMHPAFVMTVGDLINGFAGSLDGFRRQQGELTNFVSKVRAPFFYTVGNHDININVPPKHPDSHALSSRVWHEHFGPKTYYSFTYKGCLFLVLDTMEGKGREKKVGITPEQYAWARETLAKNADARWTFLFMHQPGEWSTAAWLAFEQETLASRKYTVFAGDWHTYFHVRRHGRDYYILSVAGGVSNMAYHHKKKGERTPSHLYGQEYGEMDHITWVTMTANGPEVVNLRLDGILPGDYLDRGNSKDDTMLTVMDIPPDPKVVERCRALKEKARKAQ